MAEGGTDPQSPHHPERGSLHSDDGRRRRCRRRCPRSESRTDPGSRPRLIAEDHSSASGRVLPSTRYGSSCSESPSPCPVRWMKASPYPAWVRDAPRGAVDLLAGDAGPHRLERGLVSG